MADPTRFNDVGQPRLVYRKWSSMIQRCCNPRHIAYRFYGAKGVKVCEAWLSFDAFYRDMGDPPVGTWLDRIDNAKGYEPGNCRWVTPKESAKNRGKCGPPINPASLRQRCIAAGMPYLLVYQRIKWGWPVDVALATPKRSKRYSRKTFISPLTSDQ